MKKVNMMVYPKEFMHPILASVYNMLPGGGAFNPNLSNKITFFHSVKRIE